MAGGKVSKLDLLKAAEDVLSLYRVYRETMGGVSLWRMDELSLGKTTIPVFVHIGYDKRLGYTVRVSTGRDTLFAVAYTHSQEPHGIVEKYEITTLPLSDNGRREIYKVLTRTAEKLHDIINEGQAHQGEGGGGEGGE